MTKDKETNDYLIKIANETYRIRQIFESCNTIEHVNNANKIACAVTRKWYWFGDKYSLGYACHYIWPMINDAINDMELFKKEAIKRIEG